MKFYITFGQQYRHDLHPQGGHPDGWFVINSNNEHEARVDVCRALGTKWSNIYREDDFEVDKHFYPRGLLKEL